MKRRRGGLIASSLQYPEVRFKFAHELDPARSSGWAIRSRDASDSI